MFSVLCQCAACSNRIKNAAFTELSLLPRVCLHHAHHDPHHIHFVRYSTVSRRLVADLVTKNGMVVDMQERYCSASLDIIGKAVFGYEFGSITKESPVIKVCGFLQNPGALPVCRLERCGPRRNFPFFYNKTVSSATSGIESSFAGRLSPLDSMTESV